MKELDFINMKRIQFKMQTGTADLERKMKQAQKFLEKKEQVRVELQIFGRQKDNADRAAEYLNELYEKYLEDYGSCQKRATEKNLTLTLMPKKN